MENKILLGTYIFFLIFMIFLYYPNKNKFKFYLNDIPFLIFFFYIIILTFFSLFVFNTLRIVDLPIALVMDIIPIIGFFYSRIIPVEAFVEAIIFIGIIHGILGIFMYFYMFYPSFISEIIFKIIEGTMAFRMSSVSGSLGLASLMIIAVSYSLGIFLYKRSFKLLMIIFLLSFVGFMTMQRSFWISFLVLVILVIFKRNFNIKLILSFFTFSIIFMLLSIVFIQLFYVYISPEIISFFVERINSLLYFSSQNAINERSDQWIAGLYNFLSLPSGLGLGTVGQSVRYYENLAHNFMPVFDGDYFRILSETGIIGFVFYIYLFIRLFTMFINISTLKQYKFIVFIAVIGLSINMIGSNTTEFFFNNFLYWMNIGYLFNKNLTFEGNKT
ncbi:O-antigen ligase family protein [Venenivibrio stagnispumantis]|nr:O-antigen ligase family protein [Venenivibrio stagnispumantis]